MLKLYYAYFHIPKDAKIPEKVMVCRVTLMVLVILGCLGGLSLSAYAWFSTGVSSSAGKLHAANFDLEITVSQNGQPVAMDENGAYALLPGNTYDVHMEKIGNATTGFCVLTVDFAAGQVQYHTQQIGKDGQLERLVMDFALQPDEAVTLKFTSQWGTSVLYGQVDSPRYIKAGEVKALKAMTQSVKPVVATTTQPTTAPTTQPTTAPVTQPTTAPTVDENGYIIHIVDIGENLYLISQKYGTTVDAVLALNDIADPNLIYQGQQLKIPQTNPIIPTQ